MRCYRCAKEGYIRANRPDKLCSRCNGREHTADVCPTSEEEAVLAMTGQVGARVDVSEDGTVQASAFEAEMTRQHTLTTGVAGDGRTETRVSSQ